MKLQEAFINLLKIILSLITKGSVFNIDFAEKSKEDIFITIKIQKGKGNSLFYSQKKKQRQIQLKRRFLRNRKT